MKIGRYRGYCDLYIMVECIIFVKFEIKLVGGFGENGPIFLDCLILVVCFIIWPCLRGLVDWYPHAFAFLAFILEQGKSSWIPIHLN